jgi:protein-L-isoaspartate(D-aspartate) O-methyltransferase
MIEEIETERVRRYFAEEIRAYCGLQSEALVEALASIPREKFLNPGPWLIRGFDAEMGAQGRLTPSTDPRHVYHNVSIAIDPARDLFNGQPGTICLWLEALQIKAGERVFHLGCATGYYTALMAKIVGPEGRVVAVEVDSELAGRAKENLAEFNWVEVKEGNGSGELPAGLDAILINAGATHPLAAWLDALRPGGRMILPLTFTVDGMPQNIGKGGVLLVTRNAGDYAARFISPVAIYSCAGVRDPGLNESIKTSFMKGVWFTVRRLRRDFHDITSTCWLHGNDFCLSL